MQFKEKIVLVTGASRGIGRAIAQQFAAHGATVAIHYGRNREAAETTQAILKGENHQVFRADLQDPSQVQALTTAVVETYGRIDILVNNAGIFVDHPLAEVDYEAWQAAWQTVLNTNLVGVANLMYCVGQVMLKQGHGRVVNISSRGAFRGEPLAPAYGASKAGLNALSQSLAKYLAPHNIFVGVVAPGFVETDMAAEHLAGEQGEAIRAQSPLNRVATPDEVAYATLFLAADETEFMTGAILDVNGASYLRS
jgi:3-oxoacyl-[acyl-carrier protein] reductase